MAIPDYQTLMPPTLELHTDGAEHHRPHIIHELADVFQLTDDERSELLPSGRQSRFTNRVTWATIYLAKAGLLDRPRRGVTRITDRGRDILDPYPERIVGYGGSQRDAAQRIGRSGDEGLDGAIYEDPLGLDVIYVQAKRWAPDNPVGRPAIQGFVGALHGARASKGVFLTTSRFTDDAKQYASTVTPRVVLIDGRQLAEFMIDHDVGVTPRETYTLKRLDEDFFLEDPLA